MIITGGPVITNDPDNLVITDGAVVIDNDRVVAVGPATQMAELYPGHESVDVAGRVIMPGLINTHTHAYSAYARGCATSQPTRNFNELLEDLWWRLDRLLTLEDVELNATTTFAESIRAGVTTVFDHHSSPHAVEGSLQTMADVATSMGIRACLCYETSDRDGKDVFDKAVAENVSFMKKANTGDQDQLRGVFGLHASFTLNQDSLETCAEAAEGIPGGFHVHVAEGFVDEVDSKTRYGKTVVERFAELGILGPDSIAAHCVHASVREAEVLMATNTNLVHNPQSNMGNAVGVAPISTWLARGLRIGLGTDAYTADMLTSMQVAKVLASHSTADPTVGFGQAIQMLFTNNPIIASHFFDTPIGMLKPGAKADVITVDYRPFTPLNSASAYGHMIFGMSGSQVNDTMIDGSWVMRDRELTTIDEERVFARSAERAAAIWPQM